MRKIYLSAAALLLSSFFMASSLRAQVSATGLPQTGYSNLNAAIADLNAQPQPLTNAVTIFLENPETAPAGGYVITAQGTATNTIIIDGQGLAVTAAAQAAGSTNDAVFKISGGDFITIQNFNIVENPANTYPTVSTSVSSVSGTTINVASTAGMSVGMIVYVNSGIGLFAPTGNIITSLTATSFNVAIAPTITPTSGATIIAHGPTSANTMTEFGIALYGASTSNGAKNNLIRNNNIQLNATYPQSMAILSTSTFGSAPTSGGAVPTAQTGILGGENSDNRFYGNAISKVAYGITLLAPAATASFRETGNDIGGTSETTGNTISLGLSTATALAYPGLVASTIAGITATNSFGISVRFNTISSAVSYNIAATGININGSAPSAGSGYTNIVSNNSVTLSTVATGASANLYGIDMGYGNPPSSGAISSDSTSSNTITLTQNLPASVAVATNYALAGIKCNYPATIRNVNSNTITINQTLAGNFTGVSAANPLYGIWCSAPSLNITTLNIAANNITFNQTCSATTAANSLTGAIIPVYVGGGNGNLGAVAIVNNALSIRQLINASGQTFGITPRLNFVYVSGEAVGTPCAVNSLNISNNNINTQGSTLRSQNTGSTPSVGINHEFANCTNLNISNNAITLDRTQNGPLSGISSAPTNTAATFTAIAAISENISGNNITLTGVMTGGAVIGINAMSGNTSTMTSKVVRDNVVTLTMPSTGVQVGINFLPGNSGNSFSGTPGVIAGNTINIISAGTNLRGIATAGGSTLGFSSRIDSNTVTLTSTNNAIPTVQGILIEGGTNNSITANNFTSISATAAATPTLNGINLNNSVAGSTQTIRGNTISNLTTFAGTGSGTVNGINVSSNVNFDISRNRIYGLSANNSGASTVTNGINVLGGTTNGFSRIYNNLIGLDLTACPNASNTDAVRGIVINSASTDTVEVAYNSINISAAPAAAVTPYGSSGITHTASATGTAGALHLRNNIIVNNSIPRGTGLTVALRRTLNTAGTLANYINTSNNNLFYAGPSTGSYYIYSDGTSNTRTLAQFKAFTGTPGTIAPRDSSSVTENPPFLSTLGNSGDFLRINPLIGTLVEGGGTPIITPFALAISKDFDGSDRSTTKPDIGAFEGTYQCPLPAAPTALVLTFSAGTYTGNFTGAVPSPSGGYLVVRTTSAVAPAPGAGVSYAVNDPVPGGAGAIAVANTTGTSFTNTPVAGTYWYWVFSYNTGCGTSPSYSSNGASATTTACAAPTQPTGLTLTAISTSQINGSFTPTGTPSASGYVVVRVPAVSLLNGSGSTTTITVTSTTGLAAGNLVRVVAGTGAFAANTTVVSVVNLTTFTVSIAPTVALSGATINASSSTPTGPTNGTPYTIGQSLGTGTVVAVGSSTSFSSTGLAGNTAYWYWVFPYNEGCIGTPFYNTATPLNNTTSTLPCLIPGTYAIGPSASYGGYTARFSSIAAAITTLQCGTITGAYVFEFQSDYSSTVETYPLLIPFVAGASSTNTITFRPAPGVTNRIITSANTAGTLLFQGTSNTSFPAGFIFDGRPGGTGTTKALTIENTNVGTSYAIQFENGASSNIVRWCNIRSSHNGTSGGGGTIIFGATNNSVGNNNNIIENNDIFQAGTSSPTFAIFSNGSAAPSTNNQDTIRNNNIYNHFNANFTTAGVNLAGNSTSWYIYGNSFYQTETRTYTATSVTPVFTAILSASSTNTARIDSNFIGGTAPACGGTRLTLTGTGVMNLMQLAVGINAGSAVLGKNIFRNISYTSSNSSSQHALVNLLTGNITFGNSSTPNILGDSTGTGSILVSLGSSASGVNFSAINASSSGLSDAYNIRYNKIGSISVSGTSTTAGVNGILMSGNCGNSSGTTFNITGNFIGSRTSSFSFASSLNTTITGIFGNVSNASAAQIIQLDTIANIGGSSSGFSAYTNGIYVGNSGRYTIGGDVSGTGANLGNVIYNVSSNGANIINYNASGIVAFTTTNAQRIERNTIYNIQATQPDGDLGVVGIFSGSTSVGMNIEGNTIHSLGTPNTRITNSVHTGIQVDGLSTGAGTTIQNNMIRLGISNTGTPLSDGFAIYGIADNAGANKFYHNSVYIGGTGITSGSESYAFQSNNSASKDIRYNIFCNARSNASASTPNHYATFLSNNTGTCDYNNLVSTGTGRSIGFITGQRVLLSEWRTASGRDANSVSALPGFINPTGGTPDLRIDATANRAFDQMGGTGPSIYDIDRIARSTLTLTPNDAGAHAFSGPATPTPFDFSITDMINPAIGSACIAASQTITIRVRNNNAISSIDFSVYPLTITINVTGAVTQTLTQTISTGILAAGATADVTMSSPLNMSSNGIYNFSCSFSYGNNGVESDITNDGFTTSRTKAALGIGTIRAAPSIICGSNEPVSLSLSSVSGGNIQWFSAPALTGPFTAIGGATAATYNTTLSTTTYYRADVTCVTTLSSAIATVQVTNPQVTSMPGNDSSCGPRVFNLNAGVTGGSLRWFDAGTGAAVGSGSFSPNVTRTTTYIARAESSSGVTELSNVPTIPGSVLNTLTTYPSPYSNWYCGTRHQMLVLASELQASGISAGNIRSLAFEISSLGATFPSQLNDFRIDIGTSTATALSTTFETITGQTTVYGPVPEAIPPGSSGWYTHFFPTPYYWDGVSNIIVQTSYSNGPGPYPNSFSCWTSSGGAIIKSSNTPFVSCSYLREDNQSSAWFYSQNTATAAVSRRPNMQFSFEVGCLSAITPATTVTLKIKPVPSDIDITQASANICKSGTGSSPVALNVIGGATVFDLASSTFTGSSATISDLAAVATSIPITLPLGSTVDSVRVRVNATHTYVGDLIMNLGTPSGIVNLMNRRGSSGNDILNAQIASNTAWGTFPSLAPFSGIYRADLATTTSSFLTGIGGNTTTNTFSSIFPTGTGTQQNWTLYIADVVGGDFGNLADWGITIFYKIPRDPVYSWTPQTGLFIESTGTTAYTGQSLNALWAKPTDSTKFFVSSNLNGCEKKDSVLINVNKLAVDATSLNLSNTAPCIGSNITLTQTGGTLGTGAVWRWYTNPGFTPASFVGRSTAADASLTIPAPAGNITYYLRSDTAAAPCSQNVAMTPTVAVAPRANGTWLGTTTDWHTGSNWCGGLPTSASNISIGATANNPVITATGSVNNLTFSGLGSHLTINSGGTLRVAGAITSDSSRITASGTVEYNGSVAQSIEASDFTSNTIHKLKISNVDDVVSVSTAGKMLNITGDVSFGNGDNMVLNTNDSLTLRSTATGTAAIADVTNNGANSGNNVTGKVVVERYIPAKRAWRLLTAPIKPSATATISANWQENQRSSLTSISNNIPGYGTSITFGNNPASGFDQAQFPTNHSILYYTLTGWTGKITATNGTTATTGLITGQPAYMLFVRGDRSIISTGNANATTLRVTGDINVTNNAATPLNISGTGGFKNGASRFYAFPNPYPSAIDFVKLYNANGFTGTKTFYVWNSNIGGPSSLGGWGTIQYNKSTSFFTAINANNGVLESGMGFMIATDTNTLATSLNFRDSIKVSGSTNLLLRPTRRIAVQLHTAAAPEWLIDMAAANITHDSKDESGMDGAAKMMNFGENIFIRFGMDDFVLQNRQSVNIGDTIQLMTNRLRNINYKLKIAMPGVDLPAGAQAVLEDDYLNTRTAVSLSDTTQYGFDVNTVNSNSSKADRFRIVFRPVIGFTAISANLADEDVRVNWTVGSEWNIARYELERSSDGVNFTFIGSQLANGNSDGARSYSQLDLSPAAGVYHYRVKCISSTGAYAYSNVVKIAVTRKGNGMYVFPNPVVNNTIGLQLSKMPAGMYTARLLTGNGQFVMMKSFSHAGGAAAYQFIPDNQLPAGNYQLEVIDDKGVRRLMPVLVVNK